MNASGDPRLPKNYSVLFDIIRNAGPGVHFTMNELFVHAKRVRPAIGFSTVYRGVARLRDMGVVDEIELPGTGGAVYELKSKPHAHFRCASCGRVEDVAYQLPPRALQSLSEQTGATIDGAILTLRGTCRACSARER